MVPGSARFRPLKWVSQLMGRLFCRRSIIIIADHKTQHVPFSVSTQLFGTISVLVVVIWVSYSTGSYMAAKRVLVEKDRTIATTTQENARIEAEFTLLRRDLQTLAQQQNTGKHAQRLAEVLGVEMLLVLHMCSWADSGAACGFWRVHESSTWTIRRRRCFRPFLR